MTSPPDPRTDNAGADGADDPSGHPDRDTRLDEVLRAYADAPLDPGDAVLFLDGRVAMEIAGLADHWDEVLRRNTAQVLRETARDVVLAIARPGADLQPADYRIWRELHEELRGSDIALAPVKALPAA